MGGLGNVETQALGVEVDLVVALLEDGGDSPGVLELTELNVGLALLDGVTDQLCGAGLTLCADNGRLLLLTGLVDNESGTLGLLMGDLLGLDGGGELGRESEVLCGVSRCSKDCGRGRKVRLMRRHPA